MAGVTTRATKGSPLSATEHDDNLETIINLHKSATEPSPTYACMLWADTATTLLKQRNTADSAWTTLGTLDTAGSFGGGSSDVVDDTTPQLGGNLDMQAHSIEGVDATEIAILDGATVTTAELNILDGVTSTTAELNTLDGITSTVTELNYTDGVTSAIQTQLDAKLSSVADNSVTLAKMAGGTDGNLITYDASGDPAYVTTGTSGQVLTSGGVGVAPTFQTAASGGGKVINVYSSYYTSNYYNSSIGSGTTSIPLSVTLTPDTVNSRFIIQWVVPHTSNVGYNYAELLLKRGGTTVGNPLQFFSHNEHAIAHPNLAVDSPSTTSSITYQLSATDSANNSNLWVNKGTQQNGSGSTMVVWELDS